MFPIHQAAFNAHLDMRLRYREGETQPVARGDMVVEQIPTRLKGDFPKGGIFVEVEFGTRPSSPRSIQVPIAGRVWLRGALAWAIVMVDNLARFADQGLTTFEQARSLLPYIQISLSMPVAVIGLTLDSFHPLAARYEEMKAVAEAHNVVCHPFERVFGEALLVEESDGEPV